MAAWRSEKERAPDGSSGAEAGGSGMVGDRSEPDVHAGVRRMVVEAGRGRRQEHRGGTRVVGRRRRHRLLDVDRLLHDDGRRLHDNRLLNDDRRGSHDSRSWRHDHWRGSRHCACDKPAEESAADDASCNRTTATMVVVMIMVARVKWGWSIGSMPPGEKR